MSSTSTTNRPEQGKNGKHNVAILAPTCLYYQDALFQHLASHPKIDLEVYFCSKEAIQAKDVKKQFTAQQSWKVEDELLEGYDHQFLRNFSPHPSYLTPLIGLINLGIWQVIRKQRPEVVVLMGWGSVTWWLAMLACMWFKIPYLLMADPPVQAEFSKRGLKRFLKKTLIGNLVFKHASGFLCSGTANRRLYQLYGVPDEKLVHFAYSGGYSELLKDSDRLLSQKKEIRAELGIPSDKRVALFCGRLSPEKNIHLLLEAYQRLESQDKALIIVGDGDLMQGLQTHVADRRLESVYFFGFQNRKEIGKFYAAADFLVLPSFRETWGLVVNEAMCFGLPVIASDQVGSVDDLVTDGYNGYQFPTNDVEALTLNMSKLLDSSSDEMSKMGGRSLKMIRAWSRREIAEDLSEFLEALNGQRNAVTASKQTRVLMFTRYYLPGYKAGGPVRALANLIDQLGEEFDLRVITSDRDIEDEGPYPGASIGAWIKMGRANVLYLPPSAQSIFELRRLLKNLDCDVWHFTSLFSPVFTAKLLLLRRFRLVPRKPVIVAPRGELAPIALGFKHFKKRIYLLIAKRLEFYKQVIWHASSPGEVENIKGEFGPGAQIVTAPDILNSHPMAFPEGITSEKKQGELNVVYLSRVSEMKNLCGAVEMLQSLKGSVVLNIYGRVDNEKYWRQCKAQINALPATVKVVYHGSVSPEESVTIFSQHDLFLLPTLGESFGHVIYESLAGGCPVLISDRTPWRELEKKNAGWDIPLSDESRFRSVLQECVDMGPDAHGDLRRAAHNLAMEVYLESTALEAHQALLAGKNHPPMSSRPSVPVDR